MQGWGSNEKRRQIFWQSLLTSMTMFHFKILLETYIPLQLLRQNGGLWAGPQGFNSRQGQDILLYSTVSRRTLGSTKPPIQSVPMALSSGVRQERRVSDHSPSSSTEVKNGNYTSIPPYVFMEWCLITKHRKTSHNTIREFYTPFWVEYLGLSRRTGVINDPNFDGAVSACLFVLSQ
jgi:hypothetical protein